MRKLAAIALVLTVFLGSVGIPLYQHTCLHEHITISTLFTGSDHCAADVALAETPVEETPDACCAKKAQKPSVQHEQQVKKTRCCVEDMTRLAMSFHFFEHWQWQAAIIPQVRLAVADFLPFTTAFPREEELRFAANSDPPPVRGRDVLIRHCVYRL